MLATAIPDVAALPFLGLGARVPTPEWGAALTDAFDSGFGVFSNEQHATVFPGIAMALSVLSVNFVGYASGLLSRRRWTMRGTVARVYTYREWVGNSR